MTAAASESDRMLAEAKARIGTVLNPAWRIDSLLGLGGMAVVYGATGRDGARAALKVLHLEFAREGNVRERFLREGRIARMIDHPSVVKVIGEDTSDRGEPFIVMELLDGGTLGAFLKHKGGKIPADQTLAIFAPVLELLERAHAAQIIHRDLKPANIVLTRAGQVKVLDFGVARLRGEDQSNVEATRQGTALGTPSFMAPEQALGLVDKMDHRLDLFAAGACIYTCLTGQRLHQAPTQNEALLLAATKSAPSVARAAPDLPVEVAAFVDKSLAFDKNARFPDAATMRIELVRLLQGLKEGKLTAAGGKAAVVIVKSNEIIDEEQAPAEGKSKTAERLKAMWRSLALAMGNARAFGWQHPEAVRGFDEAFKELGEALTIAPTSVRFDVSPYGFTYEDTIVWEPDKRPFDRMPYRLFGDGLRRIQIKPGITPDELRDFISILLAEGGKGDEDAVTKVWDRGFEHVAYIAIDSFIEGDAAERDNLEKLSDDVGKQALALTRIAVEEDSLEARAMQMNLAAAMKEAAEAAAGLAADAPLRATIAAQVQLPPQEWQDRFVECFAEALRDSAARADDLARVGEALREWAHDQVAVQRKPGAAFEMLALVAKAPAIASDPALAATLGKHLWSMMFPAETLRAILKMLLGEAGLRGAAPIALDPPLCAGFSKALAEREDDSLFSACVQAMGKNAPTVIQPALMGYLKRRAAGHEEELVAMLGAEDEKLALDIVRLLAEIKTEAGAEALQAAFASPHAAVRVEACRRIEGASAGTPEQLSRLLGDSAAEVRLEALRVIGRLRVPSMAPALSRRIQAPQFHALPPEERKTILATLFQLQPARAESLATEILGASKMIARAETEKSRVAAAEFLKQYGRSKESLEAAQSASRKMWWNTPAVREAAHLAVIAIEERLAGRGPRPTGGGPVQP